MGNDVDINNIYSLTALFICGISWFLFAIFLYRFYKENDENANIYDFIFFKYLTYWKMSFKKTKKTTLNKVLAKWLYVFGILMIILFFILNNR